jgi:hypothetical protein
MRSWAKRAAGWLDGASDRVFTAGVLLAAIVSTVLLTTAVLLH